MRSSLFCFNKSLKRIILKIRFHREAASLSQREVAEKLNIGHRSYQRIESGEAVCDINFLHRFCYLLNLNFLDFISPYAPMPINLELFCNGEEIHKFKNLKFIEDSHFLYFVDKFEKNVSIEEGVEFLKNENPMLVWTSGKFKPNDAFCEIFNWKKNVSKYPEIISNSHEKLNFLDCIFYYNPKFLIKKLDDYVKDGVRHKVEFYASATYQNDEILGIFILKLTPQINS